MADRTGSLITHLAVVVPAANEQELIGACLHSIRAALTVVRAGRPLLQARVVVVLDRCTDKTALVAAAHPSVTLVRSSAGCVGTARALGSRHAIAHAATDTRQVWTAHTDADSTVSPQWLAHQLDHADAGAHLVLGTVRPDLDPTALDAWTARHDLRDGHPHVHGANLGIRADTLIAVGGWPHWPEHEDLELARRAITSRYRVARTDQFAVRTSGRTWGRTPGGMAKYLRTHQHM